MHVGHFAQECTIVEKEAFLQLYSALLVLYFSNILYNIIFG